MTDRSAQRPLLQSGWRTLAGGILISAGTLAAVAASLHVAPLTIARAGAGLDALLSAEMWRDGSIERLNDRSSARQGMLHRASYYAELPAGCQHAIGPAVTDKTVLIIDTAYCGWDEQQPL